MSESDEQLAGSVSKRPAVRRPWTAHEDSALIAAVKQYGSSRGPGSAWSAISNAVGGHRTNKDCRKRWFHSLDPNLRKGKWSREEDEELKRLYAEMGPLWKEIALRIPGRKDDQVSKRWRDVLDPGLTPNKPWASLEDALLLQLFEAHGPKWTVIADHLPGRSPLACRNRSRKYLKTSSDQRNPDSQDLDQSPESVNNSPAADTTEGSESVDMFLNWPFPDIIDESHPQSHSLQFDYNLCPPSATTRTPETAEMPQNPGQIQETFDAITADAKHSDHLEGAEAISQWIASLETDLSALAPCNPGEAVVAQPQFDSTQSQPIPLATNPSQPAVSNVWALLLALESGQQSVNVDARLLRQLMSDATKDS
ncbi:hypothetical protein I316_06293 [Kwoniella heveanensis BCC8398]|uniref:Myb-like domain-containing protein n=1 Tax=Kwoniella heveanensis BCC8398 TaxID=1296120 RepID=A0A1B9GM66_9TREE|nr:hypothetical protein I316_06293 [Kwoniella heveanensis BCC8398]